MLLLRERMKTRVTPELEAHLSRKLGDSYRPLVADVTGGLRRALELPPAGSSGGEMFLTPEGDFVYYLVDDGQLEAGALVGDEGRSQVLEQFLRSVSGVVGKDDWTPVADDPERFELLREEAAPLGFAPEELEAASFLERASIRELLMRIGGQSGLTLQDAAGDRALPEVGAEIQEMEERGLLTREFEVSSLKTGQQLLRVSSLAALDEASKQGFMYDGRPLSEQRITQLLALTEAGQRLARPNLWLALKVARVLRDMGVDEDRILWAGERDFSALDIFVSCAGTFFLMEAKEGEMRPDEAFRFLARCRYYRPDQAFVVAPSGVSRGGKRVLAGGEVPVTVVEDLEQLEERLAASFRRHRRHHARAILERFQGFTRVPVGEVVGEYFFGEGRRAVSAPPPRVRPELRPPVEVAPPPTPVEEPAEVEPEAPPVEVVVEVEAEPEVEAEAEAPPEAREAEPQLVGEVLPTIGFPETEGSFEDLLREAAQKLASDVEEMGVTGRAAEVSELLREVADSDEECSSVLADGEGLIFLGDGEELELAAALQVPILASLRRALEEAELGELESAVFAGGGASASLYPLAHGLTLVSRRAVADAEGAEQAASLPGEMVLREAILRKALEGIGRLEGVRGNLVVEREGLPVEYQTEEGVDVEVLGVVFTQALQECRGHLARLGLGPLRQVLLRTRGAAWFSLMPMGEEGLLITLLQPETSPDVWQSRLPQEALMVGSVLQ